MRALKDAATALRTASIFNPTPRTLYLFSCDQREPRLRRSGAAFHFSRYPASSIPYPVSRILCVFIPSIKACAEPFDFAQDKLRRSRGHLVGAQRRFHYAEHMGKCVYLCVVTPAHTKSTHPEMGSTRLSPLSRGDIPLLRDRGVFILQIYNLKLSIVNLEYQSSSVGRVLPCPPFFRHCLLTSVLSLDHSSYYLFLIICSSLPLSTFLMK